VTGSTGALACPASSAAGLCVTGGFWSGAAETGATAGVPETGNGVPETGKGVPETGKGVPETGKGVPETGNGVPDTE
jgi:hypothetical protein